MCSGPFGWVQGTFPTHGEAARAGRGWGGAPSRRRPACYEAGGRNPLGPASLSLPQQDTARRTPSQAWQGDQLPEGHEDSALPPTQQGSPVPSRQMPMAPVSQVPCPSTPDTGDRARDTALLGTVTGHPGGEAALPSARQHLHRPEVSFSLMQVLGRKAGSVTLGFLSELVTIWFSFIIWTSWSST